jgi:MFS family permease
VPSLREQLDWEARWARPAAVAAFASVGFNVAASIYVSSSIDSRPDADNTRELLRTIDANAGVFTTGAVLSGIAGLLFGVLLWYLFNATRGRKPDLQTAALVLAILGPILLAVAGILSQTSLIDRAGEFLASGPQTEARADDIVAERPVIVQSLGLAGALALAFATIVIAQSAMRVGLLTKFLGILGIVVGALYVLGVVFPLGTDAIRLFWIVAVGLVVLGWWPGGRGPAWESGYPEEWLSPAQRKALEQAEVEEEPAPPTPAPSNGNGNGGDDASRTRTPRKRKKKRR